MDSLTHIVLGATIGEVALGKKTGNKAVFLGALLSTVPDLDVFITPFLRSDIALLFHRGISHSLLITIMLIPILGWLLSRIEMKPSIDYKTWGWFAAIPLLSHLFIDCFNTYGTGIFEPFSNIRVAYDSMAIIDLFFLIPLLICVVWIPFLAQENNRRRIIAWIGLSISTLVFLFSIANKEIITKKAINQLQSQNIRYNRVITTPAPLSNFLWAVIAESKDGYFSGYIGNFDKPENVTFRFIPRNDHLIEQIRNSKEVKNLIRFSKGLYSVEKDSIGNLWMHDLRYTGLDIDDEKAYVFSWKLTKTVNGIEVTRAHPNRKINLKTIRRYFIRVFE